MSNERASKSIRLVALSDIHSNWLAFERAIELAKALKPHAFLLLGDFLTDLDDPLKTMDLIFTLEKEYPLYCVRGNREDYLLARYEKAQQGLCDIPEAHSETGCLDYTAMSLREEDWAFLKRLPLSQKIEFDGAPPFEICHGTLRSNKELFYVENEYLDQLFQMMETNLVLHGHSHTPTLFEREGKRVVNVGHLEHPSEKIGVSAEVIAKYLAAPSAGKMTSWGSFLSLGFEEGDKAWKLERHAFSYDPYPLVVHYQESKLYRMAPWWYLGALYQVLSGEKYLMAMLAEIRRLRAMDETKASQDEGIPEAYFAKAFENITKHGYLAYHLDHLDRA